ncbi:MAG: isochorismatase family cysteine hydrolase [Acidobacteriota bacterium]
MVAKQRLAFIDIDTQFDFMDPQGTLYVPGATEIVPNLEKLIDYAKRHKLPIVASVDAHAPDDPEFKQFPPHCVSGTPGQHKIAATTCQPSLVIANSAQSFNLPEAGNLVLEKTIFSIFGNENAEKVFRDIDAEKYLVFGVATDYCVKAAALGLLARGYRVAVVEDAISGVTAEGSQAAIAEMKKAGAEIVRTADVISW